MVIPCHAGVVWFGIELNIGRLRTERRPPFFFRLGWVVCACVLPAFAQTGRTPVVVELFTSEGCSSCPAADRLLAHLVKTQPVPEADIIVLGEHVDYWNQLGWTDPFADRMFTMRQRTYARTLVNDDIYTPQMVVDGEIGFSGGDATKALSEIRRAAGKVHASMTAHLDNSTVSFSAEQFPRGAKEVEVFLAVTEDALSTDVLRGENAGRKLNHVGVVRRLESLARFDARKSARYSGEAPLHWMPTWNRENVHWVVIVQDRGSYHVLGAIRL